MKRVIAGCSDMHGQLNFIVDPCDLLIIAGDICPCGWDKNISCLQQESWLKNEFTNWFKKQPVKECVAIMGNHDWIGDIGRALIPSMPSNFHWLQDSGIELFDLKIYGTPQQDVFNNWAFNRTPEQLSKYFDEIPDGLDILISHTMPYEIFDEVESRGFSSHEGCVPLRKKMETMDVPPKLFFGGHFHGCHGTKDDPNIPGTKFINCSLINEYYKMTKKPIYLEI